MSLRLTLALAFIPLMTLTACAPPELVGCWERCGEAACTSVEGVYLDITATSIRETAADGSSCTYTYEASGSELVLSPTGCTLAQTGLPETVYWSDINRDDDTGRISYTQTKVFSEAAGLDDQVRNYTFQSIGCSEVPAAARTLR